MPTDGLGNFDVLSKRGPPRGPRSMKKSGHHSDTGRASISPNRSGNTVDIYSSQNFPGTPRETDASFWLQQQSQTSLNTSSPGRVAAPRATNKINSSPGNVSFPSDSADYYSRIPFPGDQAVHAAREFSTQSITHSNQYQRLHQLINAARPSQIFSSVVYPQPNMSASLSSPMKCKLCRLTCNSLKDLSLHFMQMHTSEGQEILASVGIYPDMVSALTWPSPTLNEQSKRMREEHRSISPQFSKVSPRVSSERSNDGSSYSTEDFRSDSYMTPHKVPSDGETKGSSLMAIKTETLKTKDSVPLDLSSSYPVFDRRLAKKRTSEDDEEEMFFSAPSSRTDSPTTSTGHVARKRSRKGKACRLEVLNPELQENWEEEKTSFSEMRATDVSKMDSSYQRGLKSLENTSMDVLPLSHEFNEKDGRKTESDFRTQTKVNSADSTEDQDIERVVSDEEDAVVCSSKVDPALHVCTHCNMGFRDRVMHSIHMGYHGFKDPFKCNMCGQRTKDRMEFFLHMAKVAHE